MTGCEDNTTSIINPGSQANTCMLAFETNFRLSEIDMPVSLYYQLIVKTTMGGTWYDFVQALTRRILGGSQGKTTWAGLVSC